MPVNIYQRFRDIFRIFATNLQSMQTVTNIFTHKKVIQDKMHICIIENLLYSSSNVFQASFSKKAQEFAMFDF